MGGSQSNSPWLRLSPSASPSLDVALLYLPFEFPAAASTIAATSRRHCFIFLFIFKAQAPGSSSSARHMPHSRSCLMLLSWGRWALAPGEYFYVFFLMEMAGPARHFSLRFVFFVFYGARVCKNQCACNSTNQQQRNNIKIR